MKSWTDISEKLSLGNLTELLLLDSISSITVSDTDIVCKTKTNPHFYYGNFVLSLNEDFFDQKLMEKKFEIYFSSMPVKHRTFITNKSHGISKEEVKSYLDSGYQFEDLRVLVYVGESSEDFEIKPLNLDDEKIFNDIVYMQIVTRGESFQGDEHLESYTSFTVHRLNDYKILVKEKKGEWFGIHEDGKVVSSLGIFHEKGICRFQVVVTHPDFQNKGYAKTLIKSAISYARKNWDAKEFVMVADPEYHAIKLYEKLGFTEKECLYSLFKRI